jgi:Rab-like protein 5
LYDTSIETGAETIGPAFSKFFNTLMLAIYEKEDKEEANLMN